VNTLQHKRDIIIVSQTRYHQCLTNEISSMSHKRDIMNVSQTR